MINQVTIVGGTHGNEFTGIYLLKKWQNQPQMIQRDSFETSTLFGNPRAFEYNRRYIDCDLNRRFSTVELNDDSLTDYEHCRAKQINQQLGPKGNAKCDFIIDLHTTTSNMGPTLILPEKGLFYRQMAAYIQSHMPEVTIFLDDHDIAVKDHYFLSTIARQGVLIEVGPVPQSVLRQDVFEQTEQMTHLILDFIHLRNRHQLPKILDEHDHWITAFRFIKSIKLPLDEQGQPTAMVHQHIQDGDFKTPITQGTPIFKTFTDKDITYQETQAVYPAFINEAAYYDNQLAMSLLSKVLVQIVSGLETPIDIEYPHES